MRTNPALSRAEHNPRHRGAAPKTRRKRRAHQHPPHQHLDARYGGYGGGLVRIVASGQITLNGSITANGRGYPFYNADGSYGGAGSGGAIYLTCRTFQGNAGASLSANGAAPARPAYAGGGGGGRIAVWRRTGESNNVTCVAAGGAGYVSGAAGTIYWGILPSPGTVITLW